MKIDEYEDNVDTFKNTLTTQLARIANVYKKVEADSEEHVATLKDSESILSWNKVAYDIIEIIEVLESLITDLEKYDQLWYDYLTIEPDEILPLDKNDTL